MRVTATLLAAIGVLACRSSIARDADAVIRDSAGVTIVESARPLRVVAATIDSLPFVDIGGVGDPHAEFPGPVHSAFRLGDGRIVLAAWATTEVRIFDSTGRWIRDLGRSGSGPGEFEGLGWVHRGPGDTLITYEPMNRRVSVFDSGGRFHRLIALQPMPSSQFPRLQGVTARGVLATAQAFQGEFPELGLVRLRSALYRFSPDGRVTDSLVELPPVERISVRGGGTWSRPFDHSVSIAVQHHGFVVGHTARYELAYYGPDDRLERLARRTVAAIDVSRSEYELAVESLAAGRSASARDRFRSVFRAAPPTSTRPVFDAVLPAPDGGVWVRAFDDALHQSRQVSQFDRQGRWVGDITLPVGLFPLQIGSDFVLGTWQDADDVTHVRLHRLRPVAP
jgi:hypothetical protein